MELQKKYPNMYIAVKGREVIAYGKRLSNVLKKTERVECTIEFIQSGELFAYQASFPLRKVRLGEEIEKKLKEAFGIGFHEVFYPIAKARFKGTNETWTEKLFTLIFDTGASITLFPTEIANYLGLIKFVEHEMTGVARKEECKLPVNMSRVRVRLEARAYA